MEVEIVFHFLSGPRRGYHLSTRLYTHILHSFNEAEWVEREPELMYANENQTEKYSVHLKWNDMTLIFINYNFGCKRVFCLRENGKTQTTKKRKKLNLQVDVALLPLLRTA